MSGILWPWGSQMFIQYPWGALAAFGAAAILLSFISWTRWNKK